MSKIFIISGNHDEFLRYTKEKANLIGEGWVLNTIYVSSVHVLKGYREPHGLFIGTWYRRKDIEEIVLQLQIASSITPARAQEIMNVYLSDSREVVNEVLGRSPE